MSKITWVLFESVLASVGLGYALFGFLENHPSYEIALSFTFGSIFALIVIGMSATKARR